MSRNLHLLLILAVGFAGCGEKTEEKTKTGIKTIKTSTGPVVAKKSSAPVISKKTAGPETGKKTTVPGTKPKSNGSTATQYVTEDFIGAVVIHPARVLNSKLVKGLLTEMEKVIGKSKVDAGFTEVTSEFGVDPRKAERVTILIDGGSATQFISGAMVGRPSPVIPSIIVRFNADVDQQKILSEIDRELNSGGNRERPRRGTPKPTSSTKKGSSDDPAPRKSKSEPDFRLKNKKEDKKTSKPESGCQDEPSSLAHLISKMHDGNTYRVIGPLAVCFPDSKTLLVSTEDTLKKMLSAKGAETPLTMMLAKLSDKHDLVLALNFQPLIPLVKSIPTRGMPPELVTALGLAAQMKAISITASITNDSLATVVTNMDNEGTAKDLVDFVREKGVKQLLAEYEKLKDSPNAIPPGMESVIKLFDQLAAGLSVGNQGSNVTVAVKRPAELDNLSKLLVPTIQQAREAARRTNRKNNLKQIGLAFHNYHDIYKRFPAADSNGLAKGRGRKSGLSWRVYLLPYLEEQALFEQFKLDEPWDSPNNKKLISKMPAIFTNPSSKISQESGKTSIHVFVGKNSTIFGLQAGGESVGSSLRDITDGTSNVILAVEAGDDKADIWTKPGGLPFDPDGNPLNLLGKLPKDFFLTLFCDGRVSIIKTSIAPEKLRLLIQHRDGKPIGDIPLK